MIILSQVRLILATEGNVSYACVRFYLGKTHLQRKQDLVAVISGGAEIIRGYKENITLDATLSYDPDVVHDDHSRMNFTWHYGEIAGKYSSVRWRKAESDSFSAVNESTIHYFGRTSGKQVSLRTAALSFNKT